jgi:hypothetical protein
MATATKTYKFVYVRYMTKVTDQIAYICEQLTMILLLMFNTFSDLC